MKNATELRLKLAHVFCIQVSESEERTISLRRQEIAFCMEETISKPEQTLLEEPGW